jgi:hypothetical protein
VVPICTACPGVSMAEMIAQDAALTSLWVCLRHRHKQAVFTLQLEMGGKLRSRLHPVKCCQWDQRARSRRAVV